MWFLNKPAKISYVTIIYNRIYEPIIHTVIGHMTGHIHIHYYNMCEDQRLYSMEKNYSYL